MARLSLNPNPDVCNPIGDEDLARLKAQYGSSLWSHPLKGCKTCGDRRFFLAREKGETVLYDCDCEQQWLLHLWLLNAGIGLSYQRLGLDQITAVNEGVQEKVWDYLDPKHLEYNLRLGRGLMLWSATPGTGKSLMATIVLKKVLLLGYDGYFTTFTDMLDIYQTTWRDTDQKRWFDRKVRNVSFLVIDDIGKEGQQRSIDMKGSMADSVIRARNAAALPTIITTNFSPEEVDQGYSVASLLSGTVETIEVTGLDYRERYQQEITQDVDDQVSRPIVML